MIYLDSAATSLWHPKEAEERMIQALRGCGNAGRGAHDATLDAGRIVFETRMRLAELFHAESPERIAFTCNDTEALNTAIFGLFGPGDHVITTVCEHNSVLRPLYALEKQGLELSVIPADVSGRIDYDQMEAAVTEKHESVCRYACLQPDRKYHGSCAGVRNCGTPFPASDRRCGADSGDSAD